MRTKTLLLSALLGTLGSVSVMAQTNVYSINAVGYINITIYPGFNMITCPLIASPDNTENTLLNESTGTYAGDSLYYFNASTGLYNIVAARASAWTDGGTNTLTPGSAAWLFSVASTNITVTFVGTVPTGPYTNNILPGFNLVGSVVPMSGDILTNSLSLMTNVAAGDAAYVFNPATQGFTSYQSRSAGHWTTDPVLTYVGQGFFYDNLSGSTEPWIEDYIVQ
jgi:hypothetical protein